MSTGPARPGTPAPAYPTGDAWHGGRRSTSGSRDEDHDPAVLVPVEEIFLAGDSMTILRHEAGSTQAAGLLDSAGLQAFAARSPTDTG